MKKRLAALILSAALGVSLTACGESGTPAPSVPPASADTNPNVIVILSESFFDVTMLPGVSYENDPVADFHRAQTEGVSGTFYTQSLGYGTCAVEMQVLTGINTGLLPAGTALYEWVPEQYTDFSALPRVFQQAGYYTAFLHTFNDSVYNRTPVYEQLGFDQICFSDGFAEVIPEAAKARDYWAWMNEHISGEFYSDDLLADGLIALCEREETSVFLYGATMENHQPFPGDKYASYDFPFTADLSEEAAGALNALTQGVASGSEALGKLMDYFSASAEPTIILFFGDHRPGMGLEEGGSLYTQLGMVGETEADWTVEEQGLMYATDYVIWANDPELLPADPGTKADASCDFLGLSALEAAGLEENGWWQQVSALREEYLAWNSHYCAAPDGTLYAAPEDFLDAEGMAKLDGMRDTLYQTFDIPELTE